VGVKGTRDTHSPHKRGGQLIWFDDETDKDDLYLGPGLDDSG